MGNRAGGWRRWLGVLGGLFWLLSDASAWMRDELPLWPDGSVRLDIRLEGPRALLSDGRTYDQVVAHAAITWNDFVGRVKLQPIPGSTAAIDRKAPNDINNLYFDTTLLGEAFGEGVLAVTLIDYETNKRTETDVVFNAAENWDSYRGPLLPGSQAAVDLLRVALHELGHVLGLDHAYDGGLMAGEIGDLDALQNDDKDGAAEAYGIGPGYTPAPPTILEEPQDLSAERGLAVTFKIRAARASRYQWYKDGAPLPGGTEMWLTVGALTEADAGLYTCDAINVGGRVTSQSVQLTVLPTRPPRFVFYPENQELRVGQSFDFHVTVMGSAPFTYQWYLEGVALPGVVQAQYTGVSSVAAAGRYEIVATNRVGETGRHSFVFTVRPPERVIVNDFKSVETALGDSFTFFSGQGNDQGLTFQWYKDGVALPGANARDFTRSQTKESDYGEYVLVTTNEAGAGASLTVRADPSAPASASPVWRQATRGGAIEYFLFDAPARVERYDRVARRWLASWPLPAAGRSLAAGAEALFVATGNEVRRLPFDGGAGSVLAAFPAEVKELLMADDWLIVATQLGYEVTLRAVHPSTGALAGSHRTMNGLTGTLSYAPASRAIFGSETNRIPTRVRRIDLTAAGQFTAVEEPRYDSDTPSQVAGTWVLPGEQFVADNTGRVYDLARADYARFLGAFDDLASLPEGGLVLLRAGVMRVLDQAWQEQGRLIVPGARPLRLAVEAGQVATFAPAADEIGVAVTWHDPAQARPPGAAAALPPAGRAMLVSHTALDREGNVLLLAKVERNLHRWSSHVRAFLPPLGLRGAPNLMAYSAARHGVYLAYVGGVVTFLDLATGEEQAFTQLKDEPGTMLVAGDHLIVVGGWFYRAHAFAADGRETSWREVPSLALGWVPASRRLIALDTYQHRSWMTFSPEGVIGPQNSVLIENSSGAPLGLDPSGSVLLTADGNLFDGVALEPRARLGRTFVGAGWAGTTLATLASTFVGARLEAYAPTTHVSTAARDLTGRPLALFGLEPDRLLGLLEVQGRPVFRFFDVSLEAVASRPVPVPSRLINLSARAWVGAGDQQVIPGFAISGHGSKQMLVRAVGPSLAPAGVSGFLVNPHLALFNGPGDRLAVNDDWGDLADRAAFLERGAAIGANPFAAGSRDAGLFEALGPGNYSAHTSGLTGGTGVSVIEVFDGTPADSAARLVNLSARARVGTGDEVLIAGFVILGDVPKRLLVHGLGPQLAKVLPGTLTNPHLTLHGGKGQVLLSNDDWIDTPEIRTAWAQAGATSLTAASRDAALLVALSPGLYSVILRGDGTETGIGMIELYEVPD